MWFNIESLSVADINDLIDYGEMFFLYTKEDDYKDEEADKFWRGEVSAGTGYVCES